MEESEKQRKILRQQLAESELRLNKLQEILATSIKREQCLDEREMLQAERSAELDRRDERLKVNETRQETHIHQLDERDQEQDYRELRLDDRELRLDEKRRLTPDIGHSQNLIDDSLGKSS